MGTKNDPGKFDCYTNAEPDEPMFVLLARDKHAPTLVWLWAVLREIDGEDQAKLKEAQECVVSMIEWAHNHGRKSVGLGQAALAAVLELVRGCNYAVKLSRQEAKNGPLTVEEFRAFLAETTMDPKEGE